MISDGIEIGAAGEITPGMRQGLPDHIDGVPVPAAVRVFRLPRWYGMGTDPLPMMELREDDDASDVAARWPEPFEEHMLNEEAGVLHDVIEDTDWTAADLRAAGVPEDVVDAVVAVTRRSGETYMALIRRAAGHPMGRLVKLADNRHNSDEDRLALLPAEQAERLRKRYARAREVLESAP